MNVNTKGAKGLVKVIDDLQDQGMFLFPAFDDHSPVDLIALTPIGTTIRLQVKYRKRMIKPTLERYELVAATVINGTRTLIDRQLIDGWAVYLADRKIVKYIPVNCMEGKNSLSIDPDIEYGRVTELGLLCFPAKEVVP